MKEYIAKRFEGFELGSVEETDSLIIFQIDQNYFVSQCPICGARTTRIHSSTEREFFDLSYKGKKVIVRLKVRQFVCGNSECKVKRFAESFSFLNPKKKYSYYVNEKVISLSKQKTRTISSKMKEIYNVDIQKSLIAEILLDNKNTFNIDDARVLENNKDKLEQNIKEKIDAITLVQPNVVDHILESVENEYGLCDSISNSFESKTKHIDAIPNELYVIASLSSRIKGLFSNRLIPLALTSQTIVQKIKYNIFTTRSDNTHFSNRVFRDYIDKLTPEEIQNSYNNMFKQILLKNGLTQKIHILDSTKIPVSLFNSTYECSTIVSDKKGTNTRGYKASCLYGFSSTSLIIEKVNVTNITANDIEASKLVLSDLSYFSPGDTLLIDRGYTDFSLMKRLVDNKINVIIPTKKNSCIQRDALIEVGVIVKDIIKDKESGKNNPDKEKYSKEKIKVFKEKANDYQWFTNPTKGREKQEYTTVKGLYLCESNKPSSESILVNAVVVRFPKEKTRETIENDKKENLVEIDKQENTEDLIENTNDEIDDKAYYYEDTDYKYAVIISTNTKHVGKDILMLYTKRMRIEEQFRQLKQFWDLCNLRSHKYKYIVFQILSTIYAFGIVQLFFQTKEGEAFANKSIKTIKDLYNSNTINMLQRIAIISGGYFYMYLMSEYSKLLIDLPKEKQNEIIDKLLKFENECINR